MAGDEGEGATPVPGNPAGFIAYHLQIGSSARESLAAWREAGGTAGNQAWYRLVGQVQDTLNRTSEMAALEPDLLPSSSDYGEIAMGRGGQYATNVVVTAVDQETGLASSSWFMHVTSDPHTPGEAQDAAMDEYGTDDNQSRYGQIVTGAFAVHVWQTVPFAMGE